MSRGEADVRTGEANGIRRAWERGAPAKDSATVQRTPRMAALERVARIAGTNLVRRGGIPALRPCNVEGARRAVVAASDEQIVLGSDLLLDRSALSQIGLIDRHAMWIPCGAGASVAEVERALRRVGLTLGSQPPEVFAGTVAEWLEGRFAGRRAMDGRLESAVAAVQGVLRDGTPIEARAAPRTAAGPGVMHLLLGGGGRCSWILGATLKARRVPLAEERIGLTGEPRALVDLLLAALRSAIPPNEARFLGRRRLELRCPASREDERAAIYRIRRAAAAARVVFDRTPDAEAAGPANEVPTVAIASLVLALEENEPLHLVRMARESCIAVGPRVRPRLEMQPAAEALLSKIAAQLV